MLGNSSKHKQKIKNKIIFLLFISSVCLAGCTNLVDFENNQVLNQDVVGSFGAGDTLGQSFLIHREPLTGIQLWLRESEPANQTAGVVTFTLAPSGDPGNILYSGQFSHQQIAHSFPILIEITPTSLEIGQHYQITLSTNAGQIQAYGRAEDIYPDGSAFIAATDIAGDLAFRLEYAYSINSIWQDLKTILSLFVPILIILAMLIIPGWMLLRWLRFSRGMDVFSQIGIMIGLSMAIFPVVMVWTSLIGFHWNREVAWLTLFIAAIIVLFAEITHRKVMIGSSQNESGSFQQHSSMKFFWGGAVVIFLIFMGTLFTRFAMVRDLSAPAWVDPVHHTLLNRMIVEDGRLPETFLPYADAPAENYHTGYHSTSAVVTWLTGLDFLNTQLVFGQVLNAVCIFAAYLFTYALTRSRFASLAAALLTGFITPMPAYYTSWGRYTQLAGLLILPAAFIITRRLYAQDMYLPQIISPDVEKQKPEILKTILLASILLAGTFFVHIRVAVFLVCLIIVDVFLEFVIQRKKLRVFVRTASIRLLAVASLSIIFSAPLFFRIIGQVLPQRVVDWNVGLPGNFSIAWQLLTAGSGRFSLVLAASGLLIALYFRTRFVALLIGWVSLMMLLAYAPQIGIPINGIVSSDSVMISLFLPISAAGGFFIYAVRRVYRQTNLRPVKLVGDVMVAALAIFCVIFGARSIITIIYPGTVYFKSADYQAAMWIDENLPAESTFLINPAPWGYGMYVGGDGGYWISPLTGSVTFPPTLLYAHGQSTSYSQINQQVREIISSANDPAALARIMEQLELKYLYLGAKGGLISPTLIVQSSVFELIFHQRGVWIFRLAVNSETID